MYLALMLQQSQPDPEQAMKIMMAVLPIFGLIMLVVLAIVIVPFWFICKKAGFSPWLALLNLVPLGQLILLYVLAFAEWKVVPVALPPVPYPYPPAPPRQ
jgi:hypothetical protein